ncbi:MULTISPECIES: type I restriction endonuclease subunit R [Nocardiaceae]|uniref:type I restriction endonuclease subunit R n=1 Tax=Nocardiaceae TaxID=85025 RepID=UPI0002AC5F5E|nr:MULTISPECIES: type I restriction endonuclease [Rhodococcus]MCC8930781.1 DEAD/DEAH box helicase family protein [Rhodococcus sp. I2R]MDJ0470942.1 DEAD/DEAH box helicase family protein [Rhodococcus fascians]CCQ13373.1 Type I restriction-modification system,restriction subunit [Rhodococcus sp. AW25M09]
MGDAQLMESEFELNLCAELSERGWLYENEGKTTGWDIGLAMVPADVLHWLATHHADEYEKAIPADLVSEQKTAAQRKLLQHIVKELAKQTKMDSTTGHPVGGLLGVLRKGFNYAQVGRPAAKFGPMMEFPPANPNLTEVVEAADSVRLRILRQVRFDTATNETIDVVLTVNGLPVVTMELKTDNTQSVNHAIRQYKEDRRPGRNRALLAPGRALVHFAVSNDLVYMTTKLEGEDTVFLPFNQGNEGHEGNPPSGTGSSTNYLWREILARATFMRVLKDFALFEPSKSGKKDGRLVFPRFHQLRAVERVVGDIAVNGTGGRYLIWHSAGSGKTKTIAWLCHRLIRHMTEDSKSTFDSVIVVTDRNVLDENIRHDMNLVQSSKGLVVSVGEQSGAKSPQLKRALVEGDHIITCTLQTFPEVMKLIEDTNELRGRRWAVVADEAHSSQSGSAAKKLKELLVDVELGSDHEDISADDLLLAKDSAIAASSNITFVALTATPKAKTLRLFGTERDGRWEAFDTYTMAQAIEEGFILDVLTNYSTYDMFLRVRNTLEGENEIRVITGQAVTNIVRFARLHPTAIAQKVRVVIEHFRRNVMDVLGGEARAMVVTSSRMEALSWSKKMNSYLAEQGFTDMKTLVAFSGSIVDEDTRESVTEVSLNNRSDVARAFREEDDSRVLIVANKFQTGFDEPRLMAMYVDKKLTGVATVQTLSRLNRTYPGKTAPMVVDFRNSPASIQKDFRLYYSDAYVEGDVDPNALYTLGERLDTADMYTPDEMGAVADAFLADSGGETIAKVLAPIKNRWNGQMRQAVLSKDKAKREELEQFRADVISYRNAWQFLSQIVDYEDLDLARRAILATLLARNLHSDGEDYDDSYLEGVQLSGVKLVPAAIGEDHSLREGSSEGIKLPTFDAEQNNGGATPQRGPLDEAIDKVNEMFQAKGVDVSPESVSGFITTFWGFLDANEEAVAMAKNNTVSQLKASEGFSGAVGLAVLKTVSEAQEIQSYMTDPAFLQAITDIAANAIHTQYRRPPRVPRDPVQSEDARAAHLALGALAFLEEGWVDGDAGEIISREVISRSSQVIDVMADLGNVPGSVFPTEQGGVRFYWPHAGNQLTIEVEPSGALYIHTADVAAGTFQDETVPKDADLGERLSTWLVQEGNHE